MKGAKIFILALILINIETILGGPCGADKLKISPKPLDLKVNKAIPITKTTADGYTPIKIGYDFTTLKRPSSMTTSTYSLVKSLLQQTRVEFSKFVQVQHTNFDLSGSADDIKVYNEAKIELSRASAAIENVQSALDADKPSNEVDSRIEFAKQKLDAANKAYNTL
jgi:hypothetical protein